jgi:hypothetical protein
MDPHRILGVHHGASKDEIKAAFRKLAFLHHPDRGGSEATFQQLNAAYQALTDGSYRYRMSQSPGKAGFSRSTDPFSSTYGFYGSATSDFRSGSRSARNASAGLGSAFGAVFNGRRHWRAFKDSGSAAITAVLAGVMLAAVLCVEPLLDGIWLRHNENKLFHNVEQDVVARKRAELADLRRQMQKKTIDKAPGSFAAQAVVVSNAAAATLPPLPPLSDAATNLE